MTKISDELVAAGKYTLRPIKNTDLYMLSPRNVALVEAIILMDSDGSVEEKFQELYQNRKKPRERNKIIEELVKLIDRKNKTHLNSDRVGRKQIANRVKNYIKEHGFDGFLEALKSPEKNNWEMLELLSRKTKGGINRRSNLSFASKFCHHASFYLFKDTKFADNFSIYDKVVRNALPRYMNHFGIDKKQYNWEEEGISSVEIYTRYQNTIDRVIQESGDKISRNGFDHLLWYTNKKKQKGEPMQRVSRTLEEY